MNSFIEREQSIRNNHSGKNYSDGVIDNLVFNELAMSEYKDIFTIQNINMYLEVHLYALLNGHGMEELLNSGRTDIAQYLYNMNKCSPAGKIIYEMKKR